MKIQLTLTKSMKSHHPPSLSSTQGESLFESYLAVFTEILGTQDIFQDLAHPIRVFAIDNKHASRPWCDPDTYGHTKFIFYVCDKKTYKKGVKETHYRVANYKYPSWTMEDPFNMYQKKGTHGFCQMFARFMAHNDCLDLLKIPEKSMVLKEYYIVNTFLCLRKTLVLVQEQPTLLRKMAQVFDEICFNVQERVHFGVPKTMIFDDFMSILDNFVLEDVKEYVEDLDRL